MTTDSAALKRATALRQLIGAVALVVATIALAVAAERAVAAFGDDYKIVPINSGAGTIDVPAIPESDRFFWAGTCDRANVPAAGTALAPSGGIGTVPATATSPTAPAPGTVDVPLLDGLRDCIDWRLGGGNVSDMWAPPPSWRLPADAQAGAHPDGSVTLALDADNGDPDNIVVDLPAGFVGDPNAVPKCSDEQFALQPAQCPPETQVGVLTSRITAVTFFANHLDGARGSTVETSPVYNLEPRKGNVAELGLVQLSYEARVKVRVVAKARTNGDFGVTSYAAQLPGSALPLMSQSITIWGVPWASSNDVWRVPRGYGTGSSRTPGQEACHVQPGAGASHVIPPGGLPASGGCRQSYEPSWGAVRPFLSNPTECSGQSLTTRLATDAYQRPGSFIADGSPAPDGVLSLRNGDPNPSDADWKTATSPAPPVSGCEKPPFAPSSTFQPTSTAADSPSGLHVEIDVPQNRDLPFDPPAPGVGQGEVDSYLAAAAAHWASDDGLATAQLDKSVVTLPDGVAVNPSAAAGMTYCPDVIVGVREHGNPPLFNNVDPFDGHGVDCPDGSKIGTLRVETPLLEEPLTGDVIVGQPHPQDVRAANEPLTFRLYLLVRNKDRGLVAKIAGSTDADPTTGRLTATFDNNPRVPFEHLELDIKGGARGVLAMPQTCGPRSTQAVFSPWTAAHGAGGFPRSVADGFIVGGACGRPFAPTLEAGMDNRRARGQGSFSFRFARSDGEQWLAGLTAKLPQGLLASVRGLPLCSGAQAAAGACPAASRIGSVDAKAGVGDPFVLEEKGDVFLTEGHKGCPYGLAVKVRAIAGPFRGQWELSPIVVRQAVCVDRETAQVTAVSDPLPTIHHGVPLRVREVLVNVDRPNFMLNPSGCAPKLVRGSFASAEGAGYDRPVAFQTNDCAGLPFRPKLSLRLAGRRQMRTGRHPGVRALVSQQGVGEAGIRRAKVRLPKSLALDVDNAQALCEFADGTKPDLENHCPEGSIVGRARAVSPLLNNPLLGDVYFVKNIRIDKDTGNEIRTLPMIIVALRGEIAINLKGVSSVDRRNRLVSTFARVPDAPVSRFNLNIKGGKRGIIAVTRTRRSRINLCAARRPIAESDMDGHNGKRFDRNIRMATPCRKRRGLGREICRKRTDNRRAVRRCVTSIRKKRATRRAVKHGTARKAAGRDSS